MADIHVLTPEPEGNGIIECLEDALALAKAGKLSSIAVATVDREGVCGCSWSYAPSFGTLLGSIASLQYKITREWLDG